MTAEPTHEAPAGMLPPVRTRAISTAGRQTRGRSLLRPARSGLFAQMEPAPIPADVADFAGSADVEEYEIVADEITIELDGFTEGGLEVDESVTLETEFDGESPAEDGLSWLGDDPAAPWEAEAGEETAEIVLDAELETDSEPADDLVLIQEEPPEPASQATGEEGALETPPVRKAPPPLSPWDLGTADPSTEAGKRVARARAEWESLGQALSDSLQAAAGMQAEGSGSHGYELTDEKAAELEDAEAASPFGHHLLSLESAATGDYEASVAELARRLEAFATSLRTEGRSALGRAQTGNDRFDALLASIAAGFLAGRKE